MRKRFPDGRYGAQSANWKGGRSEIDGYVYFTVRDHPRGRRIAEHVLVAERMLGRYLEPDEIVHHKNHVKNDNRPENLVVKKNGVHIEEHFAEGRRAAEAERKLAAAQARIIYLEWLLDNRGIPYEKE